MTFWRKLGTYRGDKSSAFCCSLGIGNAVRDLESEALTGSNILLHSALPFSQHVPTDHHISRASHNFPLHKRTLLLTNPSAWM